MLDTKLKRKSNIYDVTIHKKEVESNEDKKRKPYAQRCERKV